MNFFKLFSFSFVAPAPSSVPVTPVKIQESNPVKYVPIKKKDLAAIVLNEAADLLERDGWVQNMAIDHFGQRCVMKAISEVAASLREEGAEAEHRILKEIKPYTSILYWNDEPGRTKKEVISTLRKIAAK